MQIPIASVLTVILSATVVHAISAEDLASHVKEITDGIAVGVETLKQMGKTDHGDFFSTMPVWFHASESSIMEHTWTMRLTRLPR